MLCALDISSRRTGVAFGGASDGAPRTLHWKMPGGLDTSTLARAAAGLYCSIAELSKIIKPEHIVIEAPLQMPGRSAHTSLVLIGLFGAACAAAGNTTARVSTGNVATWRRHFCGHGRPADPKRAVMERCRQLGWQIANDDEADAAGLWCYGMSVHYPKWSPKGTPLFAARRAA